MHLLSRSLTELVFFLYTNTLKQQFVPFPETLPEHLKAAYDKKRKSTFQTSSVPTLSDSPLELPSTKAVPYNSTKILYMGIVNIVNKNKTMSCTLP